MEAQLILGVCALVGLMCHTAHAQMWNFQQGGVGARGIGGQGMMGSAGARGIGGQGMMGSAGARGIGGQGMMGSAGMWGGRVQPQDTSRFLTCIGSNMNGDEMRITFSQGTNTDNPWANRWGNLLGASSRPRVRVVISAGQSSTLNGQYQLVATTGSRVEEGCNNAALGEILSDRTNAWWGQPRTSRGRIGGPLFISAGQMTTSSESLEQLTLEELNGRGVALCRADQMSETTCFSIPLCCKNGRDTQAATTPFAVQGQMFQGGLGMQNPGMIGGMSQNQGLGMSQGFGGGMNQGMNQGGLTQGLNQGMASGMNGGLGQNGNNAGAGLPF